MENLILNKNFMYYSGKAQVIKSDGTYEVREFHDDLDKSLVVENNISYIEDRLDEIEDSKKNVYSHGTPLIVSSVLGLSYMVSCAKNDSFNFLNWNIESLNTLKDVVILFGFASLPYIWLVENDKKCDINFNKGLNEETKYLLPELRKQKRLLEYINKNKKNEKKLEENQMVTFDAGKGIRLIRRYAFIHNVFGQNEKKLIKYYKENKLDDKVARLFINNDLYDNYLNNTFTKQDKNRVKSLIKKKM